MIQIENYISSFLLKNKYCAISGLGTLELKRDGAVIRSSGSELEPPAYNISFVPIGVIDSAFPTFIANHENVSISKASNDIKTFSQDVKNELRKTGRFEIDGVGHFTFKNDTIQFYQDETLNLERDPIQLHRERTEDEEPEETLADAKTFKDLNYTHAESGVGKPKMGTVLKYLMGLLLLIGLAAAAYFGYKYYAQNATSTAGTESEEQAVVMDDYVDEGATDDLDASAAENTTTDTTTIDAALPTDAENSASAPVAAQGEYKVAVQAYVSEAEAKSKSDRLNTWGNKTTVMAKDNKYYLVAYAAISSGDTTQLKDSLRKHFNPSGTPFMVK